MITHLRGTLIEKKAPRIVIDVNGVGYEVLSPMSTFAQLPSLNESVILLTYLSISENAHQLFGFYQPEERDLFRALIKVNGIGPKLALTILSGMEPNEFVCCIKTQDTTKLKRIPGIGKKTAERLVIEIRDKLPNWQTEPLTNLFNPGNLAAQSIDDAISALTILGYKPAEAKKAVDTVYQVDHNSEQLIRLALQQMIRRT